MKTDVILKNEREEHINYFSKKFEIKKFTAKDVMINPILLYQNDSSEIILKKLKKEHINACIVVDKEKRFIGEISDNDIIRLFLQQTKSESLVKILNRGYRREFIHKNAKDMINKHKSFAKLETPINKVIELIYKKEFGYLPVLDNQEKVIGVITPSNLINLLKDY